VGAEKTTRREKARERTLLNTAAKTSSPLYLLAITRHDRQDATANINNEHDETKSTRTTNDKTAWLAK
jgi:hypothetical protein